jgi:hypothetical protein
MSRHHLIDSDLELFFTEDAATFKKKIAKRVYSPWQDRGNEKWLKFIHMILHHVVLTSYTQKSVIHDWTAIFAKLEEAGYVFKSSDYFPENRGHQVRVQNNDKNGDYMYVDMLKTSHYLDMIKMLHAGGVAVDETELHKFLKKVGVIDNAVTDFFGSIGFDLDTVLLEMSIDDDIEMLIDSNFDRYLLNPSNTNIRQLDAKFNDKLKKYLEEQSVKAQRIKAYIDSTDISIDRANEIYKHFSVSYDKMETYPEFKGRYLADICISYHMADALKTEAFYMDVQVELIRQLENKANVQFLQPHATANHGRLSENAEKRQPWHL